LIVAKLRVFLCLLRRRYPAARVTSAGTEVGGGDQVEPYSYVVNSVSRWQEDVASFSNSFEEQSCHHHFISSFIWRVHRFFALQLRVLEDTMALFVTLTLLLVPLIGESNSLFLVTLTLLSIRSSSDGSEIQSAIG
jgi:hypothetical protein